MNELFSILSESFELWTFQDKTSSWVLISAIMLGAASGLTGCFSFLEKRALIGDALAHSALPGVTTAFLLFHTKDPLYIYLGAIVSCFIAAQTINFLDKKTRLKEDAALAIVLSVFFAIGVFQLSIIQKDPTSAQAGLENILYGKAAAMTSDDLLILFFVLFISVLFITLFFSRLKVLVFDPTYFKASGLGKISLLGYDFKYFTLEKLLWLLTVVVVVTGLQLAGVVLVSALLITPAATARLWSRKLAVMLFLAASFGAAGSAIGANISYLVPAMPTGPWVVLVLSVIFFLSALFAPEYGFFSKFLKGRRLTRLTLHENILRSLFKLAGEPKEKCSLVNWPEISKIRSLSPHKLKTAILELKNLGLVKLEGEECSLTTEGLKKAIQLTRFHRLWELYLTEEFKLAPDHVHDDAEEIEHVLTLEIEQNLIDYLSEAKVDPHGRPIPDFSKD